MSNFVNTVDNIGDELLTNSIIDRSIGEIADSHTISVGDSAFYGCSALAAVNFPAAISVGGFAFYDCSALEKADFPAATSIGGNAFGNCRALVNVDFHAVTKIRVQSFDGCSALTTLILRSETMATLVDTTAFSNTPIKSGTGYIYVPAALVDSYKAATNWSTYADQFRALEDYTVDGTTTGALDEAKI